MPHIAEKIRIRTLRDEDFDAVTQIECANFPDTPRSAEEARDEYQRFDTSRWTREWVIIEDEAGSVIANGFYRHVPWSFHPDKYHVYTAVHPSLHRQGIGTRLMRYLLGRLGERGGRRVISWAREDYGHAIAFLRQFGFEEYARAFESRLLVETTDLQAFAHYRQLAADAGVVITTLQDELERVPHCLPAVYQAHMAMDISAPHDDPDLPTPVGYDLWVRDDVRHPRVLLDGYFLARCGDLYVGESALKRTDADPRALRQQLTGVLPEYRGHGIATALKLHTVEYARAHGYREIRTFNSSRNAPMLAINTKLGFVRQPAWIDFIRAERA